MQILKSSWSDTIAKIDIYSAFKRHGLTIKLDGSEDHLVSSRLKALFIKTENALCKEGQSCRDREKRKRKQKIQVASQSNNVDTSSSGRELEDDNLFDIFNE